MHTARSTVRRLPGAPHLEVRGSAIHGRGIFARRDVAKGTRLIEYVGERITKAESIRRAERQYDSHRSDQNHGAVYIFEITKRHDIDGNVSWNPARWINHSCEPNSEAVIERGRVWIEAIRDIRQGEEISYDYGYDYAHHLEHPCRCGTDSCPGYIVRQGLRWRLRKKLQKPAAR
ncbi:MAG: SET domain-containing protein-lysine N-methyltransferase [Candidatus Methylacidiphilales bacterium]|nr:SET domain-containing protein-lysine N-methyltransferase [Candidatus Methylacidiphilales bacterium]